MSETSSGGGCGGEIAPCGCMECEGAREEARARVSAKPTIPLRIRVGVTADGTWVAFGMERRAAEGWEIDALVDELVHEVGVRAPVVAWHWITAEVPMPETEQGDVAGTVEQPCAGMPSDQKVQP